MEMKMKNVKGYWWLPETYDTKVPGELIIEDNGEIILKLQGALRNIDANNPNFNPNIILGNAAGYPEITILYNYLSHLEGGFINPITSMIIKSRFALFGHLFNSEEEILFDTISFNTSNLEEWYDIRISEFVNPDDQEKITIKYQLKEPIVINLPKYKMSIETEYNRSMTYKKVDVNAKTIITLEYENKYSLIEWLDHIRVINDFIDLGTGASSYVTELSASAKELTFPDPINIVKKIEIYLPLINWRINARKPLRFEMMYTYRNIEGNIDKFLNKWVEKSKILAPINNIFFSIRNNPNIFLEMQFINITQALETYHRRTKGGKYLEDEEFNRIYNILVDAIPTGVDQAFKNSLITGRLKYANEYSMRKRFQLIIFELYDNYLANIFPNRRELATYIDKICDTRNYLTHYASELEPNIFNTIEMFMAVQRLLFIIEIYLLKEIEMDDDIIIDRIKKTNRIAQLQ
jgi:hypothetical protein